MGREKRLTEYQQYHNKNKHTDTFEERNFENTIDIACVRLEEYLGEKGFVRGVDFSKLTPQQSGTFQRLGTDAKNDYVPLFWLVSEVILSTDYVIASKEPRKLYISEVKGTNKLKTEDYLKLKELNDKAEKVNLRYNQVPIEVGLWYFENPSTQNVPIYRDFKQVREIWEAIPDSEMQEYKEKNWMGLAKKYKIMNY